MTKKQRSAKPKLKDHATMHVYPSDLPRVHKLQRKLQKTSKAKLSTKDVTKYLLNLEEHKNG